MSNLVRYPGSKARLADWIIDALGPHERYVEPFGGAASVLLAKPRSTVEVYNDLDGHMVALLEACRDHPDALAAWLARSPYSRALHDRYQSDLATGDHPDDPIEHAGRVAYVHTTSIAGDRSGGFSTRKRDRDPTNHWTTLPDRIAAMGRRLREVVVESLPATDCLDRYDADPQAEDPNDVVLYVDPPYLEAGDSLYPEGVDHDALADALLGLDARWLASYQRVPAALRNADETVVLSRESHNHLRAGTDGGGHDETDTERLVASYDPRTIGDPTETAQQTLTDGNYNE